MSLKVRVVMEREKERGGKGTRCTGGWGILVRREREVKNQGLVRSGMNIQLGLDERDGG
jgi:hypothetical protein